MTIHSDMQGPCPNGFHIMTKSELTALNVAWDYLVNTSSGTVSAGDFYKYLKMPLSGARNGSGTINSVGSGGMYWTSSAYSTTGAYRLYITASSVDSTGSGNRANGFSIRPVKDEAVAPDSSRTVLYAAAGLPETNNISRSSSLGLITITYTAYGNTYRATISDKNLGATTVWNDGDTLTDANCGNFYQWGNNNGFAHSGTLTTSSTQVDTTGYKPGNYYSNNTYIISNANWSSINNSNLWGGDSKGVWVDYSVYDRETGQTLIDDGYYSGNTTIGNILSNNLTPNYGITSISETLGGEPLGSSVLIKNTSGIFYDVSVTPGCHLEKDYSATQGPCPAGFHVPTKDEYEDLMNSLGIRNISNMSGFNTYLKMPTAGFRNQDGTEAEKGTIGYYQTCIMYGSTGGVYQLKMNSSSVSIPTLFTFSTTGASIRPFKDKPISPNSSWYDAGSGWTRIYNPGIGTTGIWWNESLGLITIATGATGTTPITITDKNLGATTVYNSGDTLSQENCGNYYQWGNNYGFPYTGTVTTSSTRVDASNYGPGNYYNSSIFINSARWDSSNNYNLWGGETGVIYTEVCPTYKLHGHIGTWHMESEKDYSAMQGPAPDGFHVPSKDEWVALCGVLTTTFSMAANATTMGTYLKMPKAGHLDSGGISIVSRGTYGPYWSSSPVDTHHSYMLVFGSSSINPQNGNGGRANALPIRCFKDEPIAANRNWTTLYDGSSVALTAGVFWNPTDGLISISGDGLTWYTIQDKNLGATTTYNDGDTLTAANCGGYFQRGNNYEFPFNFSVTTSSTKVDASTYGPGNYYSSSIFIVTDASTPYLDWDSSNNPNLWGGETGMVTRLQRRTHLLKSYIDIKTMGVTEGYPWTNTIAELNKYSTEYYNKFSAEGYLNSWNTWYALYGVQDVSTSVEKYLAYQNGTWGTKSIIV